MPAIRLWIIGLIVLFSVLVKSYTGVLLGTGGSVLGVYLISLRCFKGDCIMEHFKRNSIQSYTT